MYSVLSDLLSDHKGSAVFSCFGIWHILYMLAIFGAITLVIFLLKDRSTQVKQHAVNTAVGLAFGLSIRLILESENI